MREAIVVAWEKHPGDRVEKGEPICIVSAEGLRAAVASSTSGQLMRLLARVGARLGPGASLAEIEGEQVGAEDARTDEAEEATDDRASEQEAPELPDEEAPPDQVPEEEVPELPEAEAPEHPEEEATDDRAPADEAPEPPADEAPFDSLAEPQASARPQRDPIAISSFHSPAVMRLAAAQGVDLARVPGKGTGGRVRKEDVLAYLGRRLCERTSDSSTSTP